MSWLVTGLFLVGLLTGLLSAGGLCRAVSDGVFTPNN